MPSALLGVVVAAAAGYIARTNHLHALASAGWAVLAGFVWVGGVCGVVFLVAWRRTLLTQRNEARCRFREQRKEVVAAQAVMVAAEERRRRRMRLQNFRSAQGKREDECVHKRTMAARAGGDPDASDVLERARGAMAGAWMAIWSDLESEEIPRREFWVGLVSIAAIVEADRIETEWLRNALSNL